MRYNRKFIEARFASAMDAIGAPHGPRYVGNVAQVGVYFIDHASVYGGYCIGKITNEQGGESRPFGMARYPAAAFVAMLDGILGAAEIMNRNNTWAAAIESDRDRNEA